jgi:hypothetical protein
VACDTLNERTAFKSSIGRHAAAKSGHCLHEFMVRAARERARRGGRNGGEAPERPVQSDGAQAVGARDLIIDDVTFSARICPPLTIKTTEVG